MTGQPDPRLTALRTFARARSIQERCEMCGAPMGPERAPGARRRSGELAHEHLLDPARREIKCVCQACAVLGPTTNANVCWKRVPRRVTPLPDFDLNDDDWSALQVPIRVAFLMKRGPSATPLAHYPSPAGATESELPLEAWDSLTARNPLLSELATDTEAVLVDRLRGARWQYRVSIDLCFRLVGLVRLHWRGFTGGAALIAEIDRYFASLEEEAGA